MSIFLICGEGDRGYVMSFRQGLTDDSCICSESCCGHRERFLRFNLLTVQ